MQPVCSPTRAALMTGRYPMRYGLQAGVVRPWDNTACPWRNGPCPRRSRRRATPRPFAASGTSDISAASTCRPPGDSTISTALTTACWKDVELFNIAADPYEKENLASKNPQKLQELLGRYQAMAKQAVPPKNAPKPPGLRSPKVWEETE